MKHLVKHLLLLLSVLSTSNLYAKLEGQGYIDSLLKELSNQKEDTNKVKLLNKLSSGYWKIKPDEGIRYGQESLELATKLDWENGIAVCYNALGVNYLFKADYPTALDYFLKALKINEQTGNKNGIAGVTCNIGIIYNRFEDYPNALKYYFEAYKIDEETGNKQYLANVTGNIGTIYSSLKDYAKALDYTFKQIKIDEEIGDKNAMANAIGNIGNIYYHEDNFPKALEYYFKAMEMDDAMGLKFSIANIYEGIGNVYTVEKNYTMAIDYLLKSLEIQEGVGNKYGMASDLTNIGIAYLFMVKDTLSKSHKIAGNNEIAVGKMNLPTASGRGISQTSISFAASNGELDPKRLKSIPVIPGDRKTRLHNAIDYLQRGLAISKEISGLHVMEDGYENLEKAYTLTGDYKRALESADNYRTIKDSVISKENNDKIVKMGMENEYERRRSADSLKAAEKEKMSRLQLRRQKSYTYIGIAGILLLAGFSFFIVKERGKSEKERKKSDELLLNILPGEVAKELKITGTSKARQFDNVTVLFTDFVNFTEAGERLEPGALVEELNTCFKAFDEITGKYDIEKIKTIGDAYLAAGGLPTANPKHAENIVRAAIEIGNFMQDRLAKMGNTTFEIRIGIHSGSVVAGIVGVKKFVYDIWGDTVNTAARMEQTSEPGKINISQTTYDLVKDKINCTYRGEIDVKGKGQLKMYYVG